MFYHAVCMRSPYSTKSLGGLHISCNGLSFLALHNFNEILYAVIQKVTPFEQSPVYFEHFSILDCFSELTFLLSCTLGGGIFSGKEQKTINLWSNTPAS